MVFLLVVFACLGKVETAEEFEAAYADSQCHAYRQCNRMIFDGKYDGMADCQDKVKRVSAMRIKLYLIRVRSMLKST